MPSFFGLDDNYIQNVHKQIFQMKYYGGFSVIETYNMHIQLRTWYFTTLRETIEEEEKNKQQKSPS